jgi:myo-inositol 2-dehydrogenase / D-chiro-inositol 1-dehydrogenase
MAVPQLALLLLAQRRPHRRAARPQPRRHQLGRRLPAPALRRHGRPPGPHRPRGNIFDHFAIEYEYPGGVVLSSWSRQIDGCASRVDEHVTGSGGTVRFGQGAIEGPKPYTYDGPRVNPYVQEHAHLFASIRGGKDRLNEARNVAHSTLTAIMGRMSAYTGQEVTWDQALASDWRLGPATYALGDVEIDPVPVPGKLKMEKTS